MPTQLVSQPLGDKILRNIGLVTTSCSALEALMEFAILRQQEMDLSSGMVVTANLGFWSRWNLLMTFANEGAFKPEDECIALKRILNDIKDAYGLRNGVVHPVWSATNSPDIANRKTIRVKGRLKVVDEPLSVDEIQAIADQILSAGAALLAFMEKHGLTPEDSDEDTS